MWVEKPREVGWGGNIYLNGKQQTIHLCFGTGSKTGKNTVPFINNLLL